MNNPFRPTILVGGIQAYFEDLSIPVSTPNCEMTTSKVTTLTKYLSSIRNGGKILPTHNLVKLEVASFMHSECQILLYQSQGNLPKDQLKMEILLVPFERLVAVWNTVLNQLLRLLKEKINVDMSQLKRIGQSSKPLKTKSPKESITNHLQVGHQLATGGFSHWDFRVFYTFRLTHFMLQME